MTGSSVPHRSATEDVLIRRAARRLGLQAAAFVAVVVLLIVGGATLVLLRVMERSATDLLDATIGLADDVEDPPLDTWLVMPYAEGRRATPGLPAGAADLAAFDAVSAGAPAVDEVRRVGGVDYRVLTARRSDGTTVQAVLDLAARERDATQVLEVMALTGGAGLLLSAGVGTWLGRRALRPLSSALALQRRFVADAGHELRTPLTLLDTRAQLLRRRLRRVRDGAPLPAGWREIAEGGGAGVRVADLALRDVEEVVADSARLTEILEDLLLAADPLAERPRVPVDLVRVCRDALRTTSPDALAHGVELSGPAEDAAPVEVRGSATALHRALIALIDNALRHARRAVSVTVTTGRRTAVVDVADDGPGIDPELAPRLFTRFAGGPSSDGRTGRRRFGLGLAIVAEIAAAHGGRVELVTARPVSTDAPDRTVLRIILPLDDLPASRHRSRTAVGHHRSGRAADRGRRRLAGSGER